ncbi:MAG: alpha/beta hydrolase [Aureliella sp.]
MDLSQTVTIVIAVFMVAAPIDCYSQDATRSDRAPAKSAQSIDELLLFQPSKFPEGDWDPDGLNYKDVHFKSEDGTQLHGWYCPATNTRAVVLIAHGNAGHVASRARWLRYLQTQAKVSSFIFDYRGYGRSKGTPTVAGAIMDAKAAREQLCVLATIKDSEIVLMGESLGGAIATQLAVDSAPRGLILQSTFSSLRSVADVHYPRLSWLVRPEKLNSAALIKRFHGPLLQSHGTSDQTIPLQSGQELFDAANEPKRFVKLPGAGHNSWRTAAYLKQLNAFIARTTKR